MDLSTLAQRVGRAAAKNSPALLTALGVTGTISTAIFAARGAFEAARIIVGAEEENTTKLADAGVEHAPLTVKEKAELTWQCYVPAVASAAMTVAAIVCSNRISERRAAALASAYTFVSKAAEDYRKKTIEKVGKKKEEEILAEVVEARMEKNPPTHSSIIVTGHGSTQCYDVWNDRYFTGDMESIRRAVNDFNASIINNTHGSMTEFYNLIDLPGTGHSDEFGWTTDKLLEVRFTGHIKPDGTPCIAMHFATEPNDRYSCLY